MVIPSLLITDDDAAFRETLGGMFSPKGFRILLAGDGEEALEIVGQEEVHLVLLDIHMPRLSGLDTLRRLREFQFRSPCILLSARWDEELREQARSAEAFSLLSKPVSRLLLTNTVNRALQRAYGWPAA
jgi:two-component system chemotaxis response regulator CheY